MDEMTAKPVFLWMMVLALTLAACAPATRTSGASAIDPGWRGPLFTSLVVESESGLQERDIIERAAAARLAEAGVRTELSLNVTPPTREYSVAARKRAMSATGLQGLLVITPAGKRVVEEYIPGSVYPRGYGGFGYRHDHYGFGGFDYDPPMLLREPEASYLATIYLLPQFEKVWTGEFETRGGNGMNFDTVAARFAVALVGRLSDDGMIPVAPKQ